MPTDFKVNTGAANIVLDLCCSHSLWSMAAAISLKCLTIPAIAKHTATVVFVHVSISVSVRVSLSLHALLLFQGLGDTGHGWQPVADMFKVDPDLAHVKWVLPHSYV